MTAYLVAPSCLCSATSMQYFKPTSGQIQAFVEQHFEFKSRKGGSELVICNPFDGDTDFHFNISKVKGVCHDWHGDDDWAGPPNHRTGKRNASFVRFVQLFLSCSYQEAIRIICETSGDAVPSLREARDGHGRPSGQSEAATAAEGPPVALPGLSERLLQSPYPVMANAILRWLRSRGVDKTAVKLYNIHHAGMDVVWPYYEYEMLVYWQTRNMLSKTFCFPDEALYGVGKGQFLYNFDQVEPAEDLCITESIFCCHTLVHQCTATGGADLTSEQIGKIRLLGPRRGVILAPDNDAAGLRSIVHNARLLCERGFKVYYSLPPQIEYSDVSDGSKSVTKDWNELVQYLKMSKNDIWETMVKSIKPWTVTASYQLLALADNRDRKHLKKLSINPGHSAPKAPWQLKDHQS